MSDIDPPHEKLIEELFVAYAYMYLDQSKGIRPTFFAPTQNEEKELGYDAKFGGETCHELYLQFKKATRVKKRLKLELDLRVPATFVSGKKKRKSTEPEQILTLQCLYPRGSAFYVLPVFETLSDVMTANTLSPRDFLDQYRAFPVHAIKFAIEKKRIDLHKPAPIPCLTGSQLFDEFINGVVGSSASYNPYKRTITRVNSASQPLRTFTDAVGQEDRTQRLRTLVGDSGDLSTSETLIDSKIVNRTLVMRVC